MEKEWERLNRKRYCEMAECFKKGRVEMEQLIRVCDVEKYYGAGNNITKAVNRVSFTVEKGEFTGIMGASGSGKTTLLNMLSTIDTVTAGHIFYHTGKFSEVSDGTKKGKGGRTGKKEKKRAKEKEKENKKQFYVPSGEVDITELGEEELAEFRKKNLGFVFQDFNLLDTLTIQENIELAMTLHGKKKREIQKKSAEIMKTLGIEGIRNKFPSQVSGGQKQRCACARAIVNEPKLILADEPTGALDSKSAQMLMDTFDEMNSRMGATILMVTHDAFSASYCQRILFLKDGQIFHELYKGEKNRRAFLNEILDVLALTGGDSSYAE